jgi:N-acetylglucosaminyldiphosphoundecaprenol N-acetyl-beta-D-mannosaminyltransferase
LHFTFGATRISVNTPTLAALDAAIRGRFAGGEGFALATINVDHLEKLRRDLSFREAYAAQDFVVADGNPIVWLSWLARKPVELLPGSDLVLPLAGIAAEEGVSVALFGSTDEALTKAASYLENNVPGLTVAQFIAPPMGFDPDSDKAGELLRILAASGARLTFLALGAPKQERLAARGRREVPEMGFASIGAGLDFLAGTQRRAPRWVRRLKVEWLWRLLSNPRRLGMRYFRGMAILPGHALRAWAQRHG